MAIKRYKAIADTTITNAFEGNLRVRGTDANMGNSDILEVFWRNINPTDNNGQFVDQGPQYRTGIFYTNEKQKIEIGNLKNLGNKLLEENKSNKKLINIKDIFLLFFQYPQSLLLSDYDIFRLYFFQYIHFLIK